MANMAYIRVSTKEQNEARQKEALKKFDIDEDFWYIEKASGKNAKDRPKLQEMLRTIRKGDTLYIMDLSRLGRSTLDLYDIVSKIETKGANIVSLKGDIDTTTPTGRAIFGFMAVMAQFEREIIHERQAEGIAAAKAAGKSFGRPRKEIDNDAFNELFKRYQQRLITVTDMAKIMGVSRATVYRQIEIRKENLNENQL